MTERLTDEEFDSLNDHWERTVRFAGARHAQAKLETLLLSLAPKIINEIKELRKERGTQSNEPSFIANDKS